MPGIFRRAVKPSKSLFWFALVTAVGLSVQFFVIVLKRQESLHLINLVLLWLLWLLLPIILFAIGLLLKKGGR
jgi:hypothetical protein